MVLVIVRLAPKMPTVVLHIVENATLIFDSSDCFESCDIADYCVCS